MVGGCDPHRMDLSACVMLKDNHIDVLGRNVHAAVVEARKRCSFTSKIIVECRSLHDAQQALQAGADSVMLDNAGPQHAVEWATALKASYPQCTVEASGGIDNVCVGEYMDASIDVISMGWLTQGVPHVDFSLKSLGSTDSLPASGTRATRG